MNNKHLHHTALVAALLGLASAMSLRAQLTFDSGSDGSYGPMEITSSTTLALPPDGKFHCTTINIASNATLRFVPNAMNTPVYLLAARNVTITGSIDVSSSPGYPSGSGAGGPGGFSGGTPGFAGQVPGDGHGPGRGRAGNVGSRGGAAAYGSLPTLSWESRMGVVYGSGLLVPLIGGSGGSGTYGSDGPLLGGSGGGGAVLIASNTRIDLSGRVTARGASMDMVGVFYGLGSGGAVRLVSPVVAGNGSVDVTGGRNNSINFSAAAGDGRIRVDCMDRRSLFLNLTPGAVANVGANMISLLSPEPRLDLTHVAGNEVPVGTNAPVFFMLPQGSPTAQTVIVQARDFGTLLPIRVALTPDNAPSAWFDAQIDNRTNNPASVTVPVTVTPNVRTHVAVWTR